MSMPTEEGGDEICSRSEDKRSDGGPSASPSYSLERTLTGHELGIVSLRFSPTTKADARGRFLLASASADGMAKLWDIDTGECVHTLEGHTKGLNDVCWDPQGKHLCTASDDFTLRLWSSETGQCLNTLEGHTNKVFCCAFSPNSNKLVSGSFDEKLCVWDVKHGKLIQELPGHSDPITSVDFSIDGTLLISASYDGLCRIWNMDTGSCVCNLMRAKGGSPISCAAISLNAKFLLTASLGSVLDLWDYVKRRIVKSYTGHKNENFSVFAGFIITHPCGPIVYCGSEDGCAYLWKMKSAEVVARLQHEEENEEEEGANGEDEDEGECQEKATAEDRGRTKALRKKMGPAVLAIAPHPARNTVATAGLGRRPTIKVWVDSAPLEERAKKITSKLQANKGMMAGKKRKAVLD